MEGIGCVMSMQSTEWGVPQRRRREAPSRSKTSDFIGALDESHVQLESSLYRGHRFTANKALLYDTLHCKGMKVQYFSLENRQRETKRQNPLNNLTDEVSA